MFNLESVVTFFVEKKGTFLLLKNSRFSRFSRFQTHPVLTPAEANVENADKAAVNLINDTTAAAIKTRREASVETVVSGQSSTFLLRIQP